MTASLGTRITIGTILTTALVVSVASLAAWFAARRILYESIDGKLLERANGFASRGVPVPFLLPPRDRTPPDAPPPSNWPFMQVVAADSGAELSRSSSLPAEVSLITMLGGGAPDPAARSVRLPDGRSLRIVATAARMRPLSEHDRGWRWREGEPEPVLPEAAKGPLIVALAVDASATVDELRHLGWTLLALSGGAVLLATAMSAALRRAVLRPVARLSDAIRAMDPAHLSARIAGERAPHELATVLQRLNDLLANVERSVQRERTTIANIAHELRTPVAGLMTTLEFALADERGAEAREVHRRCLAAVTQMHGMITSLLALARLEAGQDTWTAERVDAAAQLRDSWSHLADAADRKRQTIAWSLPDAAVIASAPDKLRVVCANLLGNAVDHAPEGAAIRVDGEVDARELRLRIANPMRIRLADADSVFRAFWRGDPSRTGAHCGLGLTLVQRLVHVLGGTIAAAVEGGDFIIRLTLPVDQPGHGPVIIGG